MTDLDGDAAGWAERYAAIYIQAAKGSLRAARGVAAKALREVRAHGVNYMSAKEAASRGYSETPRYTAYMTDAQYAAFCRAADRLARKAGFNITPLDCYHD